MKQEAKPLLKENRVDATILEPEEKKKHRAVSGADSHKLERNCELKLDLDKSDHVNVVNKHHVQRQSPQQLPVQDKLGKASLTILLSFLCLLLVALVSFLTSIF